MTNMKVGWIVLVLGLVAGSGVLAFFAVGDRDQGAGGTEGVPAAEEARAADLRLEVNLDARRLTALLDGAPAATYPITVGTANHPTPRGRFSIDWIVWNPSWTPPDSDWARGKEAMGPGPDNPMGRVKLFFRQPAYYIHGTSNDGEIGRAASHGCVRLRNSDVIELAQLVMEHGGEARPPNWFKRVINRFRDTREVTLSRPVPVVIE